MAKMSAHTPGPFYVVPHMEGSLFVCADGSRGQIELATVHTEAEYARALPAEANARLMAAAPDLLEAAIGAQAFLASIAAQGASKHVFALSAAIKKAGDY